MRAALALAACALGPLALLAGALAAHRAGVAVPDGRGVVEEVARLAVAALLPAGFRRGS